jgi:DNA polymerase V
MTIFALIDCNNFYASCERIFQPKLANKPLVVLSNNDGCVIARSNEAKTLGIPMGAPYFKYKNDLKRQGVTVLSSNYALYGDLSNRVMTVLSSFTPKSEIYSIDECFLDLSGFDHLNLTEYCQYIRQCVFQWTGIPVSIGIGQTKTLSKIANKLAKKSQKANGILDLNNSPWLDTALQRTKVNDVWGIGRRWSKMLKSQGITTAYDLRETTDGWVRQKLGVTGLRTVKELQGLSCIKLENDPVDKQTVCISRSFGNPLTDYNSLKSAITIFADMASSKIRKYGLVAGGINVFVQTSPFNTKIEQYGKSITVGLYPQTNNFQSIHRAALKGLDKTFRPNICYKKAGILLTDLIRPKDAIKDFFHPYPQNNDQLSKAYDDINQRFGPGLIQLGQVRKPKTWYATQNYKTPSFTTRWDELPCAK